MLPVAMALSFSDGVASSK